MRVILLHGRAKSPSDSWYPWFVETCNDNNVECVAPAMPDREPPVLEEWMKLLDELKPDSDTVLVGHSRGGMTIMRWLEKAASDVKVKKVVLVAANNPEVPDGAMGDFYGWPYNFEAIKSHCNEFVQLHSEDDDYVPIKAGELNAAGLGCELNRYKGLEHFGNNLLRMRDIFEISTGIKLPRPQTITPKELT